MSSIEMPRNVVTVSVRCAGLNKEALYEALADALELPDWFGANLDALYDVLTDLETPVRIDLIDWAQAQLSDRERTGFETVFEDAADEAGPERLTVRFG
ncbi:MAG: barstar family protein [Sutterella sp.]